MKTVLYVTDFSTNAEAALKYAYGISRVIEAELVALNVFDIPTIMNAPLDEPTFQDIEKDVFRITKEKVEDFCEAHLGKEAARNIHYEAREDKSAVHGIVKMIVECAAELVVMGTKGESKLRELLMGSTSKGIIEKAICPVLLVPKKAQYQKISQIVYATDLEEEDIGVIQELSKIAGAYKAEIDIIHISTTHEYAGSQKMEWFKELVREKVSYPQKKFELVLSDSVYQGLNSCLMESEIDLMVMMEHDKKSIFKNWFHRDLVKRMAFHTTVPLLSYNKKTLAHLAEMHKGHAVKVE